MECYGRKEIRIPLSADQVNAQTIKEYLPYILQIHDKNAAEYKYLKGVYKGEQDILKKKRKYSEQDDDKVANYKTVENHPFSMVEFKKGFVYGNGVKYSSTEGVSTDDISILNKYMKDQRKSSKDIDQSEDIYIAGAANRLVLPKTKKDKYDIKKQAPFNIYNLDYERSCVVYSLDYKHEKLFGMLITNLEVEPYLKRKLTIYTKDMFYEFEYYTEPASGPTNSGEIKIECKKHAPTPLGIVPFVEYKLNKSRIGIVEITKPLLDSVNVLSSNVVDNIVDYVNSILAIYNMDVKEGDAEIIKEQGILPLQTNDPSKPADAKYLVNALDFQGVISEREARTTVAYNIVGVPLASASFTSGGDTGQARMLGGGWSRAEVVANQDILSLSEGERDMLEICINICNKHPECKVNDIDVNDIQITFTFNKSDNLLVKTQSLQTLHAMNFPKEAALKVVNVVSDSHEVAKQWDTLDKENKKVEEPKNTEKKEPNQVISTQ